MLRLHEFTWDFQHVVELMDFFAEGARAGDGRLDRLRVLDLTDTNVHDIGLSKLASAIEAGFGKGLEELDLSAARSGSSYVGACSCGDKIDSMGTPD